MCGFVNANIRESPANPVKIRAWNQGQAVDNTLRSRVEGAEALSTSNQIRRPVRWIWLISKGRACAHKPGEPAPAFHRSRRPARRERVTCTSAYTGTG